jgi:guanylate kinase
MNKNGNLYIVSAPSGAGKTSLFKALSSKINGISTSISTTTRKMRRGETNGKDYHFVTVDEFEKRVAQGDFLEHAEVFGNFYGTSKSHLIEDLSKGCDRVLEIDWQGAQQVKKQMPNSISIFILPPSREELSNRLKQRAQDDIQIIEERMSSAIEEISHYNEYDYLLVNDVFEDALNDLETIIYGNHLKLDNQVVKYSQLISELL